MKHLWILVACLLCSCAAKYNQSKQDPLEPLNREIYKFNNAFDATMIRPPARLYNAVVPSLAKEGINNVYNNVQMLTSVANDLLQGEFVVAYKDSWRFVINSTFGVLGIFDVAKLWGLPHHHNDLGITLGKLGNTESPYLVLPFFGPSTLRDTFGWTVDYSIFSIYPFIEPPMARYSALGLRYIDLRADLLDKEDILDEALDEYSFIRDAYLQNRKQAILGDDRIESEATDEDDSNNLYIDEEEFVTRPPLRLVSPPFRLYS